MKKLLFAFMALLLLVGCNSKEKDEKIEQLNSEINQKVAEIEKLTHELEELKKDYDSYRSNKEFEISNLNYKITELQEKYDRQVSLSNYYRADYYTQWNYVGGVELYTYENNRLYRSGEGGVYVKHLSTGDEYELRYTSGGKSYSYHVAIGHYTISASNLSMEFNAHAGSKYFDI